MRPGVLNLSVAVFCFCGLIINHNPIYQAIDAFMITLNFGIGLDAWKGK